MAAYAGGACIMLLHASLETISFHVLVTAEDAIVGHKQMSKYLFSPCLHSCKQGRAVGRSEGPGWGWAVHERLSKKDAAVWAGRQAEVKQVQFS